MLFEAISFKLFIRAPQVCGHRSRQVSQISCPAREILTFSAKNCITNTCNIFTVGHRSWLVSQFSCPAHEILQLFADKIHHIDMARLGHRVLTERHPHTKRRNDCGIGKIPCSCGVYGRFSFISGVNFPPGRDCARPPDRAPQSHIFFCRISRERLCLYWEKKSLALFARRKIFFREREWRG